MTLDEFRCGLLDPNVEVRAYLVGKLMRQAKPDDVFTFVSTGEIRALWPRLERYLGKTREFWTWLLDVVEAPLVVQVGRVSISVDSPHEILVNKLCALLGRSELRDLEDIQGLLENGASLPRALADAPLKDGGFSPLTLAWTLRGLQPVALAQAAGWTPEEAEELGRFKDELIQQLLAASAPGSEGGRPAT